MLFESVLIFFFFSFLVGTVAAALLEEDKGFTIRKAAASKQASRDQFQNRRVKEQSSIDTKKASGAQDLSALKKEQEKLADEREKLQKVSEKNDKVLFCSSQMFCCSLRRKRPRKKLVRSEAQAPLAIE